MHILMDEVGSDLNPCFIFAHWKHEKDLDDVVKPTWLLEHPEDNSNKIQLLSGPEEAQAFYFLPQTFMNFSLCPWVPPFSHTIHLDLVHSDLFCRLHSESQSVTLPIS